MHTETRSNEDERRGCRRGPRCGPDRSHARVKTQAAGAWGVRLVSAPHVRPSPPKAAVGSLTETSPRMYPSYRTVPGGERQHLNE